MKSLILKICLVVWIIALCTVAAYAQTCSQIGAGWYCDTPQGSAIVRPQGSQRGYMIGPDNSASTYSMQGQNRIYLDTDSGYQPPESSLTEQRSTLLPPIYSAPGLSFSGPSPADMGLLE